MIELPRAFLERMKDQLGCGYADFIKSYDRPPERAIRVNTLKISAEKFEKITPLELGGIIPWEQSGYYVTGEGLGKTVLHAAGAYYVQEPSAMCAVPEMDIRRGDRVLDLCAAPGGKTTQIAAYMQNKGVLVANEINYDRCSILRSNIERMGVKNAIVLNKKPQELSEVFSDYFDKILVDAPCSGEGMFKKEENAIPEWSFENVARCALRQTEILCEADKMLSVGGRLVYSTCTFSPEEDEGQIENFLKSHPNYELLGMKKLYPHEVRGEGHFCAVMRKSDGGRNNLKLCREEFSKRDISLLKLYKEWEHETLTVDLERLSSVVTGNLYSFFEDAPDLSALSPHCNRAGVNLGRLSQDGKRFEPSHTLAMSLRSEEVRNIEVDEQTALKYLRGLTFETDGNERGWRVVTYLGLPLGWCKAVNGVAKNHLPKGLRI